MIAKKSIVKISLSLVLATFFSHDLAAQLRVGGAFLKFLPGAKQQVNGTALVSDVDNLYTIWGNPGVIGMGREIGWSVARSEWISDFTSNAVFAGKRLRIGNLRQQKIMLSFSNITLPAFDSTKGRMPRVEAGDYIIGLGYGAAVPGFADRISFGVHAKYFNSELDRFGANTIAYDFGAIFKSGTRRFFNNKVPYLKSWRFSVGASLQNFGQPIKYVAEETPLPQTFRIGSSVYLGTHDGYQTRFGLGYRAIKDEADFASLAWEWSYGRVFSFYFGYLIDLKNRNLLTNYSFGLSFGLDDKAGIYKNKTIGRKYSGQLELTGIEDSDKQGVGSFANTLHFSASHFFVAPEPFRLQLPEFAAIIETDSVELTWENSIDRDLFDAVEYWVLVDTNKARLACTIKGVRDKYGRKYNETEQFVDSSLIEFGTNPVILSSKAFRNNIPLKKLKAGTYYWTVISYDKNHHYRVSDVNGEHISEFTIRIPDLEMQQLTIECGEIPAAEFVVINKGQTHVSDVHIAVFDYAVKISEEQFTDKSQTNLPQLRNAVFRDTLATFAPGEIYQNRFLLAKAQGAYRLTSEVDVGNRILESDEQNNIARADSACWTDVSITKNCLTNLTPNNVGVDLVYELKIKNEGFAPAENVTVVDELSPFVKLKSFNNYAGTESQNIITWEFATLAVGEEKTINYTVELVDPFKNIEFTFAKSSLRPVSQTALQGELGRILKIFHERIRYNPHKPVEIQGHTDWKGTETYNQGLSDRRSNSVLTFLDSIDTSGKIAKWIADTLLISRGYGELRPIATNLTDAGRQRNRRVSFGDNFFMDIVNTSEIKLLKDQNPDNNHAKFVVEIPTSLAIRFATNESKISPTTEALLDGYLDKFLPKLHAAAENIFLITGHTDHTGSAANNVKLSQERADAVLAYFLTKNVLRSRMKAVGHGANFPIAPNTTEAGREKNRRVGVEVVRDTL
ncbi:MAG: hypothetical protein DWQ05_18745 [Calditrichaeota bacterium]|nr:MAG: hypothetical protein DWQ05_18745 [Calditrichota bacterium]